MRRSSIYRTICLTLGLALMLSLVACGGSASTPNPGTKPGQPLDPQGNWEFTLTGSNGLTTVMAGQLLELNIPTVTSNTLAPVNNRFCGAGSFAVNGQASGTNSISLTVQQTLLGTTTDTPANITLTGTIAPDEHSMQGTYTVNTPGCLKTISGSGSWSAVLLGNVTSTAWSGILQDNTTATTTASITANLTENVDQTSPNMGQVIGTITVSNTPCLTTSTTLTVDATHALQHIGEALNGTTAPDANGVFLNISGTVSTDGRIFTPTFVVTLGGGTCNESFRAGTLTRP